MKKLTLSLLLVFITLSYVKFNNAQWYEKGSGLPDSVYAYAIDAYDSLIATGPFSITPDNIPDSIYLTTTGGNLWYSRPLPTSLESYDHIYDISIKDENKIWFCTGKGKIYHTNDGGFSWQLQFFDTSMTKFINYIEMFDSLNGTAMGDAPANDKPALFLKTTNGGNDWVSQNNLFFFGESNTNIWRTVDFINTNTGYYYLFNGPLYKTTNGGVIWQIFNHYFHMIVIKAYDENIFLGEDPNPTPLYKMHRTMNGGQNWESNQSVLLEWGQDIEFIPDNPSNVWYASHAVCFSNDTGRTWTEEFTIPNYTFMDIVFTNENNGWLISRINSYPYTVRIFKTNNGGFGGIVTVKEDEFDFIPEGFRLLQNYPNPFNPTTSIEFRIAEREFVSLKVYDILGNEIATLVNEEKPAGTYEVEFNSHSGEVRNLPAGRQDLPSGVYFYQLQTESFIQTKKMLLLR